MSSEEPLQEPESHEQPIHSSPITPFDHEANDIWQSLNTPVRGRRPRRRCVSCVEGSQRARTWFSSPDRFLPLRAESIERESVFRVSKTPLNLSPRERHERQRDPSADPFHSTSPSRSINVATSRHSSTGRRQNPPHFTPSFVHGRAGFPGAIDADESAEVPRQISAGAVWNVGGGAVARGGPRAGVSDGYGRLLASGTNGPMHIAHFLDRDSSNWDAQQHEDRLALALQIDQASRVLSSISRPPLAESVSTHSRESSPLTWRNNTWAREEGTDPGQNKRSKRPSRTVPTLPFRVLDAPRLRDDFYCSTLAYSYTCGTLAVALSSRVYLWSEVRGVRFPPIVSSRPGNYVTSLSFSSEEGGKAILAVGRQSGLVTLVSPSDEGRPRFQMHKSSPVSCLAFKPTVSHRSSRFLDRPNVACEDLLMGDDVGDLHYYSIEWPETDSQSDMSRSHGQIVQLAKVAAHSQQICGLAWSPDGRCFATGGNDNAALLFEVARVLQEEAPFRGRSPLRMQPSSIGLSSILHRRDAEPGPHLRSPQTSPNRQGYIPHASFLGRRSTTPSFTPSHIATDPAPRTPSGPVLRPSTTNQPLTPPTSPPRNLAAPQTRTQRRVVSQPSLTQHLVSPPITNPTFVTHGPGLQTHTFSHSAAVKAIAFAPWQPSLLATGGGSNDRQIHFFHTGSGAALAFINVFAQVTSLIWSKTKREVCATFGYAQPEHGIRIAVFAWPSGDCVVSIPWGNNAAAGRNSGDGGRALWAVAFPGGPNDDRNREGEREGQRWGSRTQEEGCIVVAGSDESVKFHEVWTGEAKRGLLGNAKGVLGGSMILEAGQGVEELGGRAAGEIIR